ncbi:MAG: nuclease-related domain-containing protein [Limisphaerales bacterium]
MNTHGLLFFLAYAVVFAAVLIGIIWWDRRRRRTRHPLPENLKLLRMPGEYLWRQVIHGDETEMQWFLGALVLPLLAGALVLQALAWCFPRSTTFVLIVSLISFVFSLLLCARFLQTRLQRRADDYLGFIGERYVAEWLDPLKAAGWFLFHDVPFDGATGKFNIDHVAVGPGGIWVVETKTRRKGQAKPGRKEHEVVFEGGDVIWPWFEESDSLHQAANNARDLADWLNKMTGKTYPVSPVLAIPGYSVVERKLGPIRLANPKNLQAVLTSSRNPVLSQLDIDLIRRQLEAKCRDVEL